MLAINTRLFVVNVAAIVIFVDWNFVSAARVPFVRCAIAVFSATTVVLNPDLVDVPGATVFVPVIVSVIIVLIVVTIVDSVLFGVVTFVVVDVIVSIAATVVVAIDDDDDIVAADDADDGDPVISVVETVVAAVLIIVGIIDIDVIAAVVPLDCSCDLTSVVAVGSVDSGG